MDQPNYHNLFTKILGRKPSAKLLRFLCYLLCRKILQEQTEITEETRDKNVPSPQECKARSLPEVTHARCEDRLDFGSGNVFGDVVGVALGVGHFSEDATAWRGDAFDGVE